MSRRARFTETDIFRAIEEAKARGVDDLSVEISPTEIRVGSYKLDLPPLRPAEPTVYFVGYGNAVKIGFTTNLQNRLVALQAGLPEKLSLEYSCPGEVKLERWLHARFWEDRLHSEWFRYSDAIKAWIEEEKCG